MRFALFTKREIRVGLLCICFCGPNRMATIKLNGKPQIRPLTVTKRKIIINVIIELKFEERQRTNIELNIRW